MQHPTPDPVQEAVREAHDRLRSIDLRKVRGEQRDLLKAARDAVGEAHKSLSRG